MSSPKKVRQATLANGSGRLTGWVDDIPLLRPGVTMSLRGVPGLWTVQEIGTIALDRAHLETRWRVGGLA